MGLWISGRIVLLPALISSAGILSVPCDLCFFSFPAAIQHQRHWAQVLVVLMYVFSLPNLINPVYIQELREMVPPPSQHTVVVCKQIVLTVIDAPVQVSDIFDLTISFQFINFSFKIFLPFLPEMSTSFMSYIVMIIYVHSVWFL
jgi:hypothetical protein